MLPSPVITSSSTPFSVKDILKLELQQQSQEFQFISCLSGLSGALPLQTGVLQAHSPPSCMLARRDSPSPISSESDERMSYLGVLAGPDRLHAESGLEMFGNPAHIHPVDLELETEQEDRDDSECTIQLFILFIRER